MNSTVILYSSKVSNRLRYIAEYMLGDLLGLEVRWVNEFNNIEEGSALLSLERVSMDEGCDPFPFLYTSEWLSNPEKHILEAEELENSVNFSHFSAPCEDSCLPIDIFSASFFLISRYEEYRNSAEKDKLNRFRADSSYLYKIGKLQQPIINVWTRDLAKVLQEYYPFLKFTYPKFKFTPTVDIDHGFYIKHKPLYKQIGGLIKYRGEFVNRLKVLLQIKDDPYSNASKLLDFFEKHSLSSRFFMLCGAYDSKIDTGTGFDKREYLEFYSKSKLKKTEIGIHFSVKSNKHNLIMKNELNMLTSSIGSAVRSNRQHFIMLNLPTTYEDLVKLGIKHDYSMGFPETGGFRAGVCTPFKFYNLNKDEDEDLVIHPFCCMDTTYRVYLGMNKEEAMVDMIFKREIIAGLGGEFIPILHNSTFVNYSNFEFTTDFIDKLL